MSRFDPALIARALAAVRAAQAGQPPGVAAEPEGFRAAAKRLVKDLCRRFEGLFLKPYLCPAGVWTVGYGATSYLDGRAVQPSDPPISAATAERLLERQIDSTYMPAAERLCPTCDTPARLAAVTDFAFNLGPTRLKASTFRKRVLERDWPAAAEEALKWNRGGGRVLRGLTLRCEARAALLRG
jgi:lysozyme